MKKHQSILLSVILAGIVGLILGGYVLEYELVKSSRSASQVFGNVNSTLGEINQAAKSVNTVTTDEAPRLKKEFEETLKVTSGFSDLVRHTDINLNGKQGTLVLLNTNLAQAGTLIQDIDNGVKLTNAQIALLQQTIQQTDKLIQDADAQVTDPNIKKLTEELAQAGDEAVKSLTHLDNITADGNKIADKYEYELTKPVKIWWTVLEKVLSLGAPIVTAIR